MAHLPMFLFDDSDATEEGNSGNSSLSLPSAGEMRNQVPIARLPRQFRDPLGPLNISDNHLLLFPRNEIIEICSLVQNTLGRRTNRSHALPLITQVLSSLRFLASGSFQHIIGDTTHISQSSCSRIFGDFCECLVGVANRFIKMDLNVENYIASLREGFYHISQFSNVLGVIDCTHIRLKKPQEDPENFMNRKGFYSLNVQAACDNNLKFTNIYVMWPGSTHDGFIWGASGLKQTLDQWDGNGWLLGDSGYPCERRLLTPFRNPSTQAEERYNTSHIRTRNIIERCFGVWKNRFRCLDTSGGCLQYSYLNCLKKGCASKKVRNIIIACAVLHNKCIERKIPFQLPEEAVNIYGSEDHYQDNDIEGLRIRREIVELHFT